MAKKKQPKKTAARPQLGDSVEILDAGSVLEEPITQTLEVNYMPYAMSVIVSRAIPEIDGFKPAHRKLLYTMYDHEAAEAAAAPRAPTSWASTMHLNPHGDAAIYDTMVRLSRGNERPAPPPRGRQGQLRQGRTPEIWPGPPRRYTEAQPGPHLRRAVPGHRPGRRRLCGQLRRHHARSPPSCPPPSPTSWWPPTHWASP